MKDIRFRAWNTRINYVGLRASGMVYFGLCDLDEDYIIRDGTYIDKETFVMQYTKRKDKNGKPIYEGDIIDGEGEYAYRLPQPVIWWRDGWYVGKAGDDCVVTALSAIKNIVILGNIYQNSEMVEVK